MINERIRDGIFYLDVNSLIPFIEHSIFLGIGKVYTFPIFIENVNLPTSTSLSEDFSTIDDEINRNNHIRSHHHVLDWWRSEGQFKNVEDFKFVNNF